MLWVPWSAVCFEFTGLPPALRQVLLLGELLVELTLGVMWQVFHVCVVALCGQGSCTGREGGCVPVTAFWCCRAACVCCEPDVIGRWCLECWAKEERGVGVLSECQSCLLGGWWGANPVLLDF